MLTLRNYVMLAATAVCVIAASAANSLQAAENNAGAKEQEAKLIAVLKSDAQPADKAMACKQLALCGTKDAVPALVPLLADEHMAAWARIALEVIPDAAVDEAFRDSLGKLNGRCLIGVINSIGIRRDAKAVAPLAAKVKDSDLNVVAAAAVALGRIADDAAVKTLKDALKGGSPEVQTAVAEGCIVCAEKRLAAGKTDCAIAMYDLVRGKSDLPKQRIREATRGAIVARKAAGVPLLVELLRSNDKETFRLGLTVGRELPGKETTDALITEVSKAADERQSLLIRALADRGDKAALPTILQAAKSGSDAVKMAAAEVIKSLGDASCVPLLLDLAVDANPAVAKTAVESLAALTGKEVDAEIVARLPGAKGAARLALLQLVGDRVLTAAVPEVIKALSDPDLAIRVQALATLGYAVEFKDLSVLIDRVAVAPENAEEAKAVRAALQAACLRMADREACAAKIVTAMGAAKTPAKVELLEVLTALGGKKALEAVAAAASDRDAGLQDAGSRLLGEWMSLDAGPELLKLAKSATDAKFEGRAVRGYIRLVRQFPMSDEQRAKMCRAAMAIAKQDAEKKLVLSVLERYASQDGLTLAAEAAETASLKADATKTVLAIAQKLNKDTPEIQQILKRLGYERVKIEIIKAEFGANDKVKDVTGVVRQSAHDLPLLLFKGSSYNAAFGGDPAPGVPKQLTIEYRMNGKPGKASFPENATVILPKP
jgi:HEAT repeat protein